MLGLFGTLNSAASSLAAQQEAMAVAGQNMANVNNPAYAREQAVVQNNMPIDTPAGEEGTGVGVVSITEVRDSLLDSQIQSENSVTGSYTAQQTALQNAEACLGEQLTNSGNSAASTGGKTWPSTAAIASGARSGASPVTPKVPSRRKRPARPAIWPISCG